MRSWPPSSAPARFDVRNGRAAREQLGCSSGGTQPKLASQTSTAPAGRLPTCSNMRCRAAASTPCRPCTSSSSAFCALCRESGSSGGRQGERERRAAVHEPRTTSSIATAPPAGRTRPQGGARQGERRGSPGAPLPPCPPPPPRAKLPVPGPCRCSACRVLCAYRCPPPPPVNCPSHFPPCPATSACLHRRAVHLAQAALPRGAARLLHRPVALAAAPAAPDQPAGGGRGGREATQAGV